MSYYHKPENTNNAQRVLEFYHQVLKEFTIKLDKEFRYKGIITSEQIERMELIVNQRLLQPGVLFDKFLTMKETSKAEYDLKNDGNGEKEPKLKEEYNEDNDQYLRGQEIKGKEGEDSDGDDFDDLGHYQQHMKKNDGILFKSLKSEGQVKKEDNDPNYIQKKVGESDPEVKQEQGSEAHQNQQEQLPIEQCLQNLNTTFAAASLKHKPKQEKIIVNLDNTFVKSDFNEIFIGAVSVDVNKIEKSDIRHQFPRKAR